MFAVIHCAYQGRWLREGLEVSDNTKDDCIPRAAHLLNTGEVSCYDVCIACVPWSLTSSGSNRAEIDSHGEFPLREE